jgi:hypothetical protein
MSNVINNKVPPITENMNQMPTMFSANNTADGMHKMSQSTHSITAKKIDFPPTQANYTGHRANNSFSNAGAAMMGSNRNFGR